LHFPYAFLTSQFALSFKLGNSHPIGDTEQFYSTTIPLLSPQSIASMIQKLCFDIIIPMLLRCKSYTLPLQKLYFQHGNMHKKLFLPSFFILQNPTLAFFALCKPATGFCRCYSTPAHTHPETPSQKTFAKSGILDKFIP